MRAEPHLRHWRLAPGASVCAPADDPVASAIDLLFAPFACAPVEGHSLSLRTHLAQDGLQIWMCDLPLITITPRGLVPFLERLLTGLAVRYRTDALALHAGAVARDGGAIVLLGEKGGGKSTLTRWLGEHGARHVAEEVTFVRYEDETVAPFPRAIAVKGAPSWRDPMRGLLGYRAPREVVPPGARLPVRALCFVAHRAGATPMRAPLAPPEVALRLVHQSFGGLDRDPRALALIAHLAERPAWSFVHGEADEVGPSLLEAA